MRRRFKPRRFVRRRRPMRAGRRSFSRRFSRRRGRAGRRRSVRPLRIGYRW